MKVNTNTLPILLLVLLISNTTSSFADLDFRIKHYFLVKKTCKLGTDIKGTSIFGSSFEEACAVYHFCLEFKQNTTEGCNSLFEEKLKTVCKEEFTIFGRISCSLSARRFVRRVEKDEDYEEFINLEDVPKILLCIGENWEGPPGDYCIRPLSGPIEGESSFTRVELPFDENYNDSLLIPSKNEDGTWKIQFKSNLLCLGAVKAVTSGAPGFTGLGDWQTNNGAAAIDCQNEKTPLKLIPKDEEGYCFFLEDVDGQLLEADGFLEFDSEESDADEFCWKTLDEDNNLVNYSLKELEMFAETFKKQ